MFDRDGDGFIDPVPTDPSEWGSGGCGCLIALFIIVAVWFLFA